MTIRRALLLDPRDSVAVLVEDVEAGEQVAITGTNSEPLLIQAMEPISMGHKMAIRLASQGSNAIKYGLPIGQLLTDIKGGHWVHSHNLGSALHREQHYAVPQHNYEWTELESRKKALQSAAPALPQHFQGWRRKDGSVGIRNELWVLPLVGCITKGAEQLAEFGRRELGVEAHCYSHPFGCSQLGDDLSHTLTILSALARHPNAGGVLVVSLGCENLRPEMFREALGSYDPQRIRFLHMQDSADEMEEGRALLRELAAHIHEQKSEQISIRELVIGLKCGGSDGFSGISANPLVGRMTEMLIALGASAVQTEVPEMFGAEAELMARSCNREVFEAQVSMIDDFKHYFISHGQEVYENPSPGNRDGGITTLEEKSLGCIRKSGSVPVMDVKPYGHQRTTPGLTLLAGPGNDQVSTTNLAAAGCHLILFTTGRGTPYGAPVPTLKIASHSRLAQRKPGWIDFNAGVLLEGRGFNETAIDLLRLVMATASGKTTKAEHSGYRDMAIFKDGVTL